MGTGIEQAYAEPTFADPAAAVPGAARDKYSGTPRTNNKRGGLLGRGWRKMTWVLIAYSTLTVLVAMGTAGSAGNKINSACQSVLADASTCQQVGNQTAVAQFEHVMKLGLFGFIVLAVSWYMTRPQN